ncbi:response regulator [Pedobacter changchengzhani]|uniref:Response regulator n=1 Tax=Pedobacter changchengzhani TaxID=2529274 RepID=A0A4R5MJM0_9SPHI|nr:response regulator [Pedobacter changchengzhani]TDG35847.1 response regulator [Pedobacter changchengzhani]
MKDNIKILIADDNQLLRVVMKNFFLEVCSSSKILETGDLEQTYNTLKTGHLDFLLLDINMPTGDATPEVVKGILANYPSLRICMFSGNEKSKLEQIYLEAGAMGFIQKDEKMKKSLKDFIDKFLVN